MRRTALLLGWLLVTLGAPSAARAIPVFAAPVLLDHQPPFGVAAPAATTPLTAIACPSETLCVAADRQGDILTSTEPTAGSAGWRTTAVDAHYVTGPVSDAITSVACPSRRLCVAVDNDGNALISRDPTGGATAWTTTQLNPVGAGPSILSLITPQGFTGVSCPTTGFCAAIAAGGEVYTTRDPTGPPAAWHHSLLDRTPGPLDATGISCPSIHLCVAVDTAGNAITSSDPSAAHPSWRITDVAGGALLRDVTCASATRCVASSGTVIYATTDPTGGRTWPSTTLPPALGLDAISCPSTALCEGIDGGGQIYASTGPWSTTPDWTERFDPTDSGDGALPVPEAVGAISCPGVSFCAAVDVDGNALVSIDPAGGGSGWRVDQIDGAGGPTAVSCTGALCVTVDSDGNVITHRGAVQSLAHIDSAPLTAVACASSHLCVAGDQAGLLLASSDPTGGASAWTIVAAPAASPIAEIACPSETLCVAVDAAGDALSSTQPLGATWAVTHVDDDLTTSDAQAPLTAVACPSTTLCVAADGAGDVLTSTTPTAGPSAWTPTALGTGIGFTDVACPSISLCLATTGAQLFVSHHPTGGVPAWASSTPPAPVSRLACPSTQLCVVVGGGNGNGGTVATTTDPGDGTPRWSTSTVEPLPLIDVSCGSRSSCAAINAVNAISFAGPPPARPGVRRFLKSLLAGHGRAERLAAPSNGMLEVTWRAGRAVLATGAEELEGGRPQWFTLTPVAGSHTAVGGGRRAITATASFTPTGNAPVTADAEFRERRDMLAG
jgi:hypothetical protein